MGSDLNLTKEVIAENKRKNLLLKAPISYDTESLEFPDFETNFTPKEVKMSKKINTEIVDIKKNKKNKSNKLL